MASSNAASGYGRQQQPATCRSASGPRRCRARVQHLGASIEAGHTQAPRSRSAADVGPEPQPASRIRRPATSAARIRPQPSTDQPRLPVRLEPEPCLAASGHGGNSVPGEGSSTRTGCPGSRTHRSDSIAVSRAPRWRLLSQVSSGMLWASVVEVGGAFASLCGAGPVSWMVQTGNWQASWASQEVVR